MLIDALVWYQKYLKNAHAWEKVRFINIICILETILHLRTLSPGWESYFKHDTFFRRKTNNAAFSNISLRSKMPEKMGRVIDSPVVLG